MSEADGYEGLDLDARSVAGRPLLKMIANDWSVETVPDDLVVGNRYNNLHVDLSSHRIHFELRFRSFSADDFRVLLVEQEGDEAERIDEIMSRVREWPLAVCNLVGEFVWPSEVVIAGVGIVSNRYRHLYQWNIYSGVGIDLPL